MKRITALLASLVLGLGLVVTIAPAARADEPVCESVPELPGECLTEAVHDFILAQQKSLTNCEARVVGWQAEAALWRKNSDVYQELYESNAAALEFAGTHWQWWQEKAVAQDQEIALLRAKVARLRERLHDLRGK